SGRPMDNEEWFPLKQTHYPPPTIPSMKTGHPTGPISIGHIIPDLRHLDNVINCKGFEPFPPNMDVFTAHYEQCHFGDHLNSEFVVQAKAAAPIENIVPGVDVTGSAGLHHTNITSDRWEYDSVVEYAVYPTRQYIDRLLESKEVRQYIQKSKKLLGGWCVYMVTGIMVARGGGRNVTSEEKGAGVSGNVGFQVPGIGEFAPEVGWDTKTKTKVNAHHTTDFVCAIRLVKIAKSGLRSSWTMKKVTREF
uniref:Gasdermin-like protein rcd-1-2 n=1 Tax=Neurospora crassa TaxID=5141 RepID=UPI00315B4034